MPIFNSNTWIALLFVCHLFGASGCSTNTGPRAMPGYSYGSVHPDTSPILVIGESYFKGNNYQGPSINSLMEMMDHASTSMVIEKGYRVASRKHINRLINEIRFREEPLSNNDALKIGRMVGADSILIVTLNDIYQEKKKNLNIWITAGKQGYRPPPRPKDTFYLYSEVYVSARIVNIERAITTWTAQQPVGGKRVGNAIIYATRSLMSGLPSKG